MSLPYGGRIVRTERGMDIHYGPGKRFDPVTRYWVMDIVIVSGGKVVWSTTYQMGTAAAKAAAIARAKEQAGKQVPRPDRTPRTQVDTAVAKQMEQDRDRTPEAILREMGEAKVAAPKKAPKPSKGKKPAKVARVYEPVDPDEDESDG